MSHKTTTGVEAVHVVGFHQDTDPSLDVDNHVGPGKAWFDSTINRLKIRNDDDDGWLLVGGE